MSSAAVFASAASSRPFVFDDEVEPEVCSRASLDRATEDFPKIVLQSAIKNQKSAIPVIPASRLEIRPAPEMISSGIPALDALTGGLPLGCLTEICGPASSGRTTVLLAALAAATRRGEYCALIDASDTLDPESAAASGVELDRVLWVRCGEDSSPRKNSPRGHRNSDQKSEQQFPSRHANPSEQRLEQVLRATDLLLESGGFALIALDLADLPPHAARRIPLTTWFRFRRAVENKLTILLAIEQQPIAGSCSSLLLQLSAGAGSHRDVEEQKKKPAHAQLLTGFDITAEIVRSRLMSSSSDLRSPLRAGRKPSHSVSTVFTSKTAWG